MIQYLLLLGIGFIGLWYSAKKTVDNSEVLVQKLGISGFTFAAVFVSVSTGLPEIFTALVSTLDKVPELSAGDIIGSSLINLTLIFGITIITAGKIPLGNKERKLIRVACTTVLVAASVLFFTSILNIYIAVILLIIYGIFLSQFGDSYFEIKEREGKNLRKHGLKTGLGLIGLVVFARVTVFSALNIGQSLKIPLEILGATVIAIGTGLPELAFEVTSVKKGDYKLALGDIFGSTVVNITLVTGLLGFMNNMVLNHMIPVLLVLIAVSSGIFVLSRDEYFSKYDGVVLLGIFLLYIFSQLI